MKKLLFPALIALALPLSSASLHAQAAPVDSVADRHKALNALFHDYWEASLANDPSSPPLSAISATTTRSTTTP